MGTDVVFIGQLSARVKKIERGVVGIRKAADDVGVRLATPTRLTLARHLIGDPAYQVRALGVFMLGDLAARSAPALKLLRDTVSADDDPRVQQVLAKAFDAYCAEIGYAQALPTIDAWLGDRRDTVRRAVIEGLRVWTARAYFSEHPEEAVRRLAALRQDPNDGVRRSVGKALRDISRTHRDVIARERAG